MASQIKALTFLPNFIYFGFFLNLHTDETQTVDLLFTVKIPVLFPNINKLTLQQHTGQLTTLDLMLVRFSLVLSLRCCTLVTLNKKILKWNLDWRPFLAPTIYTVKHYINIRCALCFFITWKINVCVCARVVTVLTLQTSRFSSNASGPFSSLQSTFTRAQIRLHLTPNDAIWEAEERSFYTMLVSVMVPTWRRAGAGEWGLTAPYVKETVRHRQPTDDVHLFSPSLLSSYLPFFFLSYLLPSFSSSSRPPPPWKKGKKK